MEEDREDNLRFGGRQWLNETGWRRSTGAGGLGGKPGGWKNAECVSKRLASVIGAGGISQQNLESAQATLDEAKQRVKVAEAKLKLLVHEPELGEVPPGTKVILTTDGRPERPFHGTVGLVSPKAEFTPKSVETPKLRTSLVSMVGELWSMTPIVHCARACRSRLPSIPPPDDVSDVVVSFRGLTKSTTFKMMCGLLSKMLPYYGLGITSLMICVVAAHWVLQVPFRGSFMALWVVGSFFLLSVLGIGLAISTGMKNQFNAAQAALNAAFFPAVMLSGFIYEISSMPLFLRGFTHIIPARYFVSAMQTIFQAGTIWKLLLPDILMLMCTSALFHRKTA